MNYDSYKRLILTSVFKTYSRCVLYKRVDCMFFITRVTFHFIETDFFPLNISLLFFVHFRFGSESCCMMLRYGFENLGISLFEAKIKMGNSKSLKMFQEKLKFAEISRSEVFQEVSLEAKVDSEFRALILSQTQEMKNEDYQHYEK